jgi:hypothetical protein
MVEKTNLFFEISINKYYILPPEHYIKASHVIHHCEECTKIVSQIVTLNISERITIHIKSSHKRSQTLPSIYLGLIDIVEVD